MLKYADVIIDHKAQLGAAAEKFQLPEDNDFKRHITTAARDLSDKRPRYRDASIELIADQEAYTAPDDLYMFLRTSWGDKERYEQKPWQKNFIDRLPQVYSDRRQIIVRPAPTQYLINRISSTMTYTYVAYHCLNEVESTINDSDHGVLMLRALIVAIRELAALNITKPITLNRGQTPAEPDSTPQAVLGRLNAEWNRLRSV